MIRARPHAPGAPPLPEAYGVPRLILMVKDPHWIFAYWESPPQSEEPLWLWAYETDPRGEILRELSGLQVAPVDRCYLHVPEGGRYYRAAIRDARGRTILTSNVIFTPPGRPSSLMDGDGLLYTLLEGWLEIEGSRPSSAGFQPGSGGGKPWAPR